MMAETGCQSVMIGRGALGSPWVFDETFESLPPDQQRDCKARVIARHCALIREHFREKYALIQMKKHLAWYTEGLGHATRCRAEIFQSRSAEEAWEVFGRYWEIDSTSGEAQENPKPPAGGAVSWEIPQDVVDKIRGADYARAQPATGQLACGLSITPGWDARSSATRSISCENYPTVPSTSSSPHRPFP